VYERVVMKYERTEERGKEALKRAVISGSERHSCHWALTGQPENQRYGILPKDDLSRSSQAAAVHY
jgi:hypothetical protein